MSDHEDEEGTPLLSEADDKKLTELTERQSKLYKESNNHDDDRQKNEEAPGKNDSKEKSSKAGRFRRGKSRKDRAENDDEKVQNEGKGDSAGVIPENDHQEEDPDELAVSESKKKQHQPTRNANCCMPVATCLASCLGGMGLGYRVNDGQVDSSALASGRVIDTRMWNIIKNSASFKNVEDSAFCINIGRLSDLQGILSSAVKPFVKVHIVDIDTGHYIRPNAIGRISVPRSAPLLTRQAALRGTASDVPQWDEELCFPGLSFKDAVSPQNLILFEVLDDPPSLSFRKAQSMNSAREGGSLARTYTTLAWAFLLPVGQRVNVGYPKAKPDQEKQTEDVRHSYYDMSLRLQLYQYKVDNVVTCLQRVAKRWPAAESSQQKRKKTETSHRYPDNIPEVYLQYKRKNLEVLCSVLEIATGHRPQPENMKSDNKMDNLQLLDDSSQQQELDPRSSHAQEDAVKAQLRAAKLKRTRALNEPCVIPNKVLRRVDAGPEGGMVVKYSHRGHLLAVAGAAPGGSAGSSSIPFAPVGGTSPYAATSYSVRLFDPDTGVEVWSDLFAHFGVIYDIQWSLSDTFLLTCSSDGCCKVWKIKSPPADEDDQNLLRMRQAKQMRRRSSLAGIGIQANLAISAFQDELSLVATLAHNPPVYVYSAIFKEYSSRDSDSNFGKLPLHPPVITGAADGRIRVWEASKLTGDLIIGEGDGGIRKSSSANRIRRGSICENDIDTQYRIEVDDIPHYGGKVQALAIDVRSKYLFSGDSRGQILIWRPNKTGWYQYLRKFRKDDLIGRSISSLTVYPDRAKGFLLVLALPALVDAPAAEPLHQEHNGSGKSPGTGKVLTTSLLKLYDLGTYRAQHTFPGVVINSTFCRATLSADGRYAACGTIIRNHDGIEKNHIRLWDTLTGRHIDTKIASLPYAYFPRSISWHPRQHVLTVAMVGQGAAIGMYCANKAKNTDVAHDFAEPSDKNENTESGVKGTTSSPTSSRRLSSFAPISSPGRLRKFKGTLRRGDSPSGDKGDGNTMGLDGTEIRTKEQRTARTKEILEKIRAAKARARGEDA